MHKDREKIKTINMVYLLIISLIGFMCVVAAYLKKPEAVDEFDKTEVTHKAEMITVYITGEVNEPGIYEIEQGTRVLELIEQAGGSTPNADLEGVNLVKVPKDGDQIKVPKLKTQKTSGGTKTKSSSNATTAKPVEVKVELNCGKAEEYAKIKGIDPVVAQNIANHVNSIGKLTSVEELQFVEGVTPSVYKKLEEYFG